MDGLVLAGTDEILHLHLLELARAEDEVAGRDFVAERFSDLRDAEGNFAAHRRQHVLEIDEDALRRFGAKIGERRGSSSSATAPMVVRNIRLKGRGSVQLILPQFGHLIVTEINGLSARRQANFLG